MAKKAQSTKNKKVESNLQKKRLSQTDVPSCSLEKALRIPEAIAENYGGQAATPLQVAKALGVSPSSSAFRMQCGAALAYGLTDGGYNAAKISITPLSKK